jgi:hypothetical protein
MQRCESLEEQVKILEARARELELEKEFARQQGAAEGREQRDRAMRAMDEKDQVIAKLRAALKQAGTGGAAEGPDIQGPKFDKSVAGEDTHADDKRDLLVGVDELARAAAELGAERRHTDPAGVGLGMERLSQEQQIMVIAQLQVRPVPYMLVRI